MNLFVLVGLYDHVKLVEVFDDTGGQRSGLLVLGPQLLPLVADVRYVRGYRVNGLQSRKVMGVARVFKFSFKF